MFEFYSDGSTHQLEFEWEVVEKFSSWHAMMPTVLSTFLYNIDDTTAFKTRNIGGENAKFLVIANEHETSTDDEIQYMSDYQLTVNDSLLLLMQKDYTMLEKFSEYYQQ
ncbi:hypothetical protein AGMMS49982_12740 [Bacteroidia bacterium]|nr:hypothetical protein AGMMS49982_12740 [Bacteroidia bacterium]